MSTVPVAFSDSGARRKVRNLRSASLTRFSLIFTPHSLILVMELSTLVPIKKTNGNAYRLLPLLMLLGLGNAATKDTKATSMKVQYNLETILFLFLLFSYHDPA